MQLEGMVKNQLLGIPVIEIDDLGPDELIVLGDLEHYAGVKDRCVFVRDGDEIKLFKVEDGQSDAYA